MALSLVAVGAKITAAIANGIINAINASGSALVPPTSVAGTGVSMTTLGKVTFTSATAVSLNGIFTGAYDNYRVIIDITNKTATTNLSMVLRRAGTDDVSASYSTQRTSTNGTTATSAQGIALTSWVIDAAALTGFVSGGMDIIVPALARSTIANLQTLAAGATLATNIAGYLQNAGTSYDGFTLTAASGTITGTIRVYGYNNG